MYKALFIDIDGTLIKKDHTVSEATSNTIRKLREKNIIVILVSARPLAGIMPIANEIALDKDPIASLNGAYIAAGGKVLFESVIDASTIGLVHEQLLKYEATIIYYEHLQWFSESRDYYTDYEQKITEIPITIQPFNKTLQSWRRKNSGPNKIHVMAPPALVNEIQKDLQRLFINDLCVSTSKPTYLEVINIAASKVNAIKLLLDHYNIKKEEVIAIGDNFNDMEMIAFAGTGIAMGNAPDEVKAIANYVTDTNNNDGVSKALEKFFNL